MTLVDYLSKHYLSADSKASKKRKRKGKSEGLTIAEDEDDGFGGSINKDDDDDDDIPTIVGSLAGGLNVPSKKAKWVTIGSTAPTDAEQQTADAILADAQAEAAARAAQDDDAPALVGEDGEDYDGPTMANGAMAGLQTAEQVSAALKRREKAEKRKMKEAGLEPTGMAQETIYRDASGRIINVAAKRAQLRAQAAEEERKQAEAIENAKGDVQRREKEERKQALADAKTMSFARHADDEKMNEELKERERWNDPMAQLLAAKKSSSSSKTGRARTGRATYAGASEPNRYGIKPGWRWDGVDRSNGFERKWFAARNKAKDRQNLEYSWQMDE